MKTILLCSDLDRTLIPNGAELESPSARPLFSQLAARRTELRLAYVSGRDKHLVREAVRDFDLPEPDFVIGDVGTSLYHVAGDRWHLDDGWLDEIGRDWHGRTREDIAVLVADAGGRGLELQPPEKQNRYKISYYTDPSVDPQPLKEHLFRTLAEHRVPAHIIWSRDDEARRGLLDILPRRANKLQAIRFLMRQENIDAESAVFAGDSGNDLDVLTSGMQAIIVKNAAADVRRSALDRLDERGQTQRLYQAKGDFHGMNGNYAAGVLEGLVHFFPETADWIQSALNRPAGNAT
jgi:hypothetical protein